MRSTLPLLHPTLSFDQAWEHWDDQHVSENDHPRAFPNNQLCAPEFCEARSLLVQAAAALAVAELANEFIYCQTLIKALDLIHCGKSYFSLAMMKPSFLETLGMDFESVHGMRAAFSEGDIKYASRKALADSQ
ncbi:hypothetical protein Pint_04034 [Pistacia integerrima]|uniref:Uncharacterized protein n=1 Tax=Pistacia integerrima TaxID=434235 RepID=A0ACC0Z681_9ROSI|nr:hypothetical protein Pint_04034 [Pistacia integerrima]